MIDFETEITEDGIVIASIRGNLDALTTEYFFECMETLINDGHRKIIVDCDGLGYISSVGLGNMVRARAKAIKSGGRIYLAAINAAIAEAMTFSGLGKLFDIYPTAKMALETISVGKKVTVDARPSR